MFNWSGLRALVELVHARGDRELDLALVAHGDRARGAGDRQHSAEGPELAVIGVRADLDRGVAVPVPDLEKHGERVSVTRTPFSTLYSD